MANISRYFRYSAIFHVVAAAVVTSLVVVPELGISRIIAGGGAGTWFTIGYLMYLITGPAGSLFFSNLFAGYNVNGFRRALGLATFVLVNVGVIGSTYLLMYAGYNAGYMQNVLPAVTGQEANLGSIHNFLVNFVNPIGIFTVTAVLGGIVGALNGLALGFGTGRRTVIPTTTG